MAWSIPPVAQLAWIVEKFWSWSDCDGHPRNAFSRDELLDNVMLYWLTGTGASSARLYWESFSAFGKREPVRLPTGVAGFPEGDPAFAADLVRTALQHHPLDDDAARRALRRVRTTRSCWSRMSGRSSRRCEANRPGRRRAGE